MATTKKEQHEQRQRELLEQVQRTALPTGDETYLKRMESTLEVAEQGMAEVETIDRAHEVSTAKRTTLNVSVVIPVYNECGTIREIVRRVQAMRLHHEILIVDDYSLDGTRNLLLELDQEPDVRVFMHGYNRGKGAALRTAFQYVEGDVILVQDADLEYNPEDYQRLLAPIERGEAEVVYGSRFLHNAEQDPSRLHRAGNRLLTRLSNWATGQNLTDMETCYKIFRRDVLQSIRLEQNGFGFEPEITAKISKRGYKITEVPISYEGRGYEEGKKIRLRDAINALYCILRYRNG